MGREIRFYIHIHLMLDRRLRSGYRPVKLVVEEIFHGLGWSGLGLERYCSQARARAGFCEAGCEVCLLCNDQ